MALLRFEALKRLNKIPRMHMDLPSPQVSDFFGENVFSIEQMRASLAPAGFRKVSQAIKNHEKIDANRSAEIAGLMPPGDGNHLLWGLSLILTVSQK